MKNKITLIVIVVLLIIGAFWYLTGTKDTAEDMAQTNSQPYNQKLREIISYETPVDSPNECSSYEDYDADAGVCYYECESEAECTEIENAINEELDSWADDIANDKDRNFHEENEDDVKMIATYVVNNGEKITFKTGNNKKEYQDIWEEVAILSPNNLSDKYIEKYEVFDDKNNDTLAFVDDSDMNGKWRIAINLAGRRESSLREQKATLVHELGHIITLNTSQVENKETCSNYKIDEGCPLTNSYLNTFYNKYWKGVKSPAKYDANKYVTEYATSEPVEDLAESFAFFVLEKDAVKLGNTVREQKIKHFYQFAELTKIRDEMRGVLGRDIVRARKMSPKKAL